MAGSIHDTLRERFGFATFRPGQQAVVETVLRGQPVLAVFPTGSGKSLCYQLSALHLDGLTVVVSPLIALMKDQLDFLQQRNISSARLDSSVEAHEFKRINAQLEAGSLKLLYVAPERFSNEGFIHRLRRLKIAQLVIDEAHCISEWGHNFRPDYLKLAGISRALGIERVMALTATATPAVANDICREFKIAPEAYIHTGFYRPNLELRVSVAETGDQLSQLLACLRQQPAGATIVYVTLQRTAEFVANELARKGFAARPYHAGLESDQRSETQDWFMHSEAAIVVATIAFGMGIDKANIRSVYHYNLPKSLENYSQEIGRAGRDGLPSKCQILACADDLTILENFTFGDTPERESIASLLQYLMQNEGEFDLSTYELSRDYDLRPLVLNTLLTYLELAGVLEPTAPFYTEYHFQPLHPSAEILGRFEGERAVFLRQVFANAVKARTWFSIDLEKTAKKLECARERLVKALTYLEETGDLTLKVAGLRHGFRVKKKPANLDQLTDELVVRFDQREANDVSRVAQVMELVCERGCLVRSLLRHFGEELGHDCGHCGTCLGDAPANLARPAGAQLGARPHRELDALRHKHPRALRTPRQLARFLCGLSSPLATQTKLNKHPLYGSFGSIPFGAVLDFAEKL